VSALGVGRDQHELRVRGGERRIEAARGGAQDRRPLLAIARQGLQHDVVLRFGYGRNRLVSHEPGVAGERNRRSEARCGDDVGRQHVGRFEEPARDAAERAQAIQIAFAVTRDRNLVDRREFTRRYQLERVPDARPVTVEALQKGGAPSVVDDFLVDPFADQQDALVGEPGGCKFRHALGLAEALPPREQLALPRLGIVDRRLEAETPALFGAVRPLRLVRGLGETVGRHVANVDRLDAARRRHAGARRPAGRQGDETARAGAKATRRGNAGAAAAGTARTAATHHDATAARRGLRAGRRLRRTPRAERATGDPEAPSGLLQDFAAGRSASRPRN
jgi:hypothetical protein